MMNAHNRPQETMAPRIAAIVLTALLAGTALQCARNTEVPVQLIGVWKTDAPRYEECFLEIREKVVLIGTREGNVETGAIRSVDKTTKHEMDLYTIRCVDVGQSDFTLNLYHDAAKRVIRLKNQEQIVWTKAEELNQ